LKSDEFIIKRGGFIELSVVGSGLRQGEFRQSPTSPLALIMLRVLNRRISVYLQTSDGDKIVRLLFYLSIKLIDYSLKFIDGGFGSFPVGSKCFSVKFVGSGDSVTCA
jgi:hypothetical protein